ncbi:hypothetical protein GR702_18535 [Novosphingobium sp. FGD1]|jgi:hypothetical protein|uniref:Uncharacterized protein n=1 Tax=Novosphingobium silvae TaxID=2692619 RepID=A0A7X4K8Y4_9SPHN|nr:hypothetical protein [Novosphingobium silvae]MYL99759.1 hypothetical protein [Novosphingobium silvae]
MFKTVLATAAVALLAVPAVASADEAREFSHEGVNYAYTTEQKGKVTVINGATSAGVPFRLYVKGDRVSGTYNSRNVSFSTAEAAKLNLGQ